LIANNKSILHSEHNITTEQLRKVSNNDTNQTTKE